MFAEDITGKKVEYLGKKLDEVRADPVPPGTRGTVETMFTTTAIVHWDNNLGSSVLDHSCIKLIEE